MIIGGRKISHLAATATANQNTVMFVRAEDLYTLKQLLFIFQLIHKFWIAEFHTMCNTKN